MGTYDDKKEAEPDILIADAIPADGPPAQPNGPPIPPGHNRFYCEKCRTVCIKPLPVATNVIGWLLLSQLSLFSLTFYCRVC